MNVNTIFGTVVQATVFGSVVGIIIFILKSTLLRKLAAKWQYLLWSVMIVKLIFPNGPESKISIFNKINVTGKISETDLISMAYKPQQITEQVQIQSSFEIADIIPYIWLAGFVVAILWTLISFVLLKYKIHTSSSAVSENTLNILENCKEITGIHKNIRIVVQNHVLSTALYGIIKPKILITKDFENSDISHIKYTFIHELSHYKRGDIAVNYLLLFLRCVHWFNPVIWFLFSKIRRDTELATDERTMNYLSPDEHKSYGMALINAISSKSEKSLNILGMADNKKDIKKRIKAIASFKKTSLLQHIYGFLTILLIATVSLTSAVVAKPISNTIYNNIPMLKTNDFKIYEKYEFGTGNLNKPKEIQPEEETVLTEDEAFQEEAIVENDTTPEYMYIENLSIDTVIESTGQVIDNSKDITNLNQNAKIVYYNTDYDGAYNFKVIPNNEGYIQFLIENEGFNHDVYIGIYHIDSKGRGWDYCFNTKTKSPIYLDGYEPGEVYVVTVSCYCPGHYNINGRILVY